MGVGDPVVETLDGNATGFRILQSIGLVHRYVPVIRSLMFLMVHRYAQRI